MWMSSRLPDQSAETNYAYAPGDALQRTITGMTTESSSLQRLQETNNDKVCGLKYVRTFFRCAIRSRCSNMCVRPRDAETSKKRVKKHPWSFQFGNILISRLKPVMSPTHMKPKQLNSPPKYLKTDFCGTTTVAF